MRILAPYTLRVQTPAALGELPGVTRVEHTNHTYTLTLGRADPQDVLRLLNVVSLPSKSYRFI